MTPVQYAKLSGAVLVVVLLFGGGFYFGGLRGDAKAAQAKTALEADHAAQLRALATAWQARELETQAKDARHDKEIDALKDGALTYPTVAVRLCPSAANPVVSTVGPVGGSAGAGSLPGKPVEVSSFDVGPYLFALADAADKIVADCRRTQPANFDTSKSH